MRFKTYFASSVESAMLSALKQLGPDAMILNSRKTPAENIHLGEYEVAFAAAIEEASRNPVPQVASETNGQDDAARLQREVSRLALEIESLRRTMNRNAAARTGLDAEQSELAQALSDAGLGEEFIAEVLSGVSSGPGSLQLRVLQLLAARLRTAPSLGRMGHGRKVVALVGPAGAGKSGLIAKLAARFGVEGRRPCQILSLDSDRIGATEPLRLIAGVLGVGFRLIEDASQLCPALDAARDCDLILIDTPGFIRDESDIALTLARTFVSRDEIEVHLVLPASMKRRDTQRALQFYEGFQASKLMYTRLDETEQIGTLVETAIRSNLPVSFLSNGPRIPEDLELADGPKLARRVLLPAVASLSKKAAA